MSDGFFCSRFVYTANREEYCGVYNYNFTGGLGMVLTGPLFPIGKKTLTYMIFFYGSSNGY